MDKEKINWLTLGTSLMAALFLVVDLICAIQIDGVLFKIAFTLIYIGQTMAIVYICKDFSKEEKIFYDLFLIFYALSNIVFAIAYIVNHTIGGICLIMSALILLVLVFFKDIKEERTRNLAIIICLLQVINVIFLNVNHVSIASRYNFGHEFVVMGVYASPIVMSLVQIQMIRMKYINKNTRGSN